MDGEEKTSADQPGIGDKASESAVMISPSGGLMNAAKTDADRNAVFLNLVREDGDIVGLVAYSIYKQNKVDWLNAFQKALGRNPAEAELTAYIIGESTPRRLAIYRHLAAATLAGNGPDAATEGAWVNAPSSGAALGDQRKLSAPSGIISSVLAYGLLAAVILIGVWLVARYGIPAHS